MRDFIVKVKNIITLEHCVIRFIMAWCFVSLCQTILIDSKKVYVSDLNYLRYTNFPFMMVVVLVLAMALYAIFYVFGKLCPKGIMWTERLMLLIVTLIYSLVCASQVDNVFFICGMIALMTFSVTYCFKDTDTSTISIPHKLYIGIMIVSAIIFTVVIGTYMVVRYLSYSSPNFDMGLFSQMFHYMRTTGTMNTTSERDHLMSHMCVHIAPDFYLLLPFYAIYPSPATLELMQVVVLALAVIPLSFLCREKKLSRFETVLIVVSYLLYPVTSGGCFYDIHENMFYPLFIFTFLLFMEKNNNVGMIISMLLVWGVKEDSGVFMAFIALYMILGKKMYKKGTAVLVSSLVYFFVACKLIEINGAGVVSYRFNNMILEGDGNMLSIIKTVFSNPAYVMSQIFQESKIKYIVQTMGPLLFMPLFSKKWQRFILLGPYILFNLVSGDAYFSNIFFQYSFGPGAILLYMTILNVSDMNVKTRSAVFPMILVSCSLFFTSLIFVRVEGMCGYFNKENRETYAVLNEGLSKIPDDASVIATTFLCPKLSKREYLYELYYTDKQAEYVALDLRFSTTEYNPETYLEDDRYETIYYVENKIGVFRDKYYTGE